MTFQAPNNDNECKELLKSLGRTDEQINAIFEYAALAKSLKEYFAKRNEDSKVEG